MKFTFIGITAFLLFWTCQVQAQQVKVRVGLNVATQQNKNDFVDLTNDISSKLGFQIGALLDYPISDMFSVEGGLVVSTKGSKLKYNESDGVESYESDTKTNLVYLDIPVTLKARKGMDNFDLFALAGPYIGIGLAGKTQTDSYGQEYERDISWGNGESDTAKRLDAGWLIGAGVEVKSIEISLSYGLGLANLSTSDYSNSKIRNRVASLTVGYRFGAGFLKGITP